MDGSKPSISLRILPPTLYSDVMVIRFDTESVTIRVSRQVRKLIYKASKSK